MMLKSNFHPAILFGTAIALLLHSCNLTPDPGGESGDPIITPVGETIGEAVSALIGPEGGELNSSDGLVRLSIPPDALASPVAVSVQKITQEAPLGVGTGYRLFPEGLTFLKPVELEFSYDDALLSGGGDFLWVVTQAGDGSWNAVLKSEQDREDKTVKVMISHFSDWSLGRFVDLTLDPASASVEKGKSVELKLSGFYKQPDAGEEDELAPLSFVSSDGEVLAPLTPIPSKEARLVQFRVKRWQLNGENAPVSNASGRLTPSGNSAVYQAPEIIPEINPVAVSAVLETTDKNASKSSYTVNSNVTIIDEEYYIRIKSDNKTLLYYQYGIRTSTPVDSEKFGSVLCGLTSEGALGVIASFVDSPDGLNKDFGFRLNHPAKGSNSFMGSAKNGDDDLWFFPTFERYFTLDYQKRSIDATGSCITVQGSGEATLKLDVFTGAMKSEVTGSFTGTIYEDNPEYMGNCRTPDARQIEGEFRLLIYDHFAPVKRARN